MKGRNPRYRRGSRSGEKEHRVNDQIRLPEVRVVDEEGNQLGVMKTKDALEMAQQKELDLVEIVPQSKPPVCKIIDYGKFKYTQKKKLQESKKKQKTITVKEIKMRPKIEEHDYNFKLNHIKTFLEGGDKVKVTVTFRGREITHLSYGESIMEQLKADLEDLAVIEKAPKLEGKNMIMVLAPNKS